MATAWVRSLSCRSSYAVTDAAIAPTPTKKPQPPVPFSCATAAAADVMDAVAYAQQQARRKKMGRERERERRREAAQREPRPRPKKKPKPMATKAAKDAAAGALFMPSPAPAPPVSSAFLTMAELPEGHSSRRVVELIFASGWGGGGAGACAGSPPPEPPTVEALFRVHSSSRAVARFEEARAAARAHGAAARCGADGNEMMRFQCRASPADADAPGGVFGAGVATCRLGASASAVRTFACSGAAHASSAATGGGGGATAGRRAMLVCRVIAGRVCPANHPSPRHAHGHGHGSAATAYDSVDMGNGELVVLDSRAVLPCFLIIYKV